MSCEVRGVLHKLLALACAVLAVWPGPATATETEYALPSPLSLQATLSTARGHRAEIASASARARAASERPKIDSALPDPMLMASVDHLPFSFMGADVSLAIEQQFPLSSVLGKRKRAALAGAQREASEVQRVRLDVEREAVSAFFMLLERRRMLEVLESVAATNRELLAIAQAHYGAAHGTQADVLRAESELLRVAGELRALEAEVAAAESMLNAALGRPPELPIPELSTQPLTSEPPPLARAVATALQRRPELASMRHEHARALAEVDVMQSMYSPMAVVRAGPAYTMAEGPGAMIMLGVSVPIWRGRLSAGVAEANAMVQMTNFEIAAMANMIRGEVAASREQVEAERRRFSALHEQIRPKAEQAVQASLASYAAAGTPAVAVIESVRSLWDVRSEEVMAEVRLGLAWARLERAVGEFGMREGRRP